MFSGMCGSDLLLMQKKMDAKDGVTPGHEIAGKIEAVGSKIQNLKAGDSVVVMPQNHCGKCRFCLRGQVRYCIENEHIGFDIDGGWVEYCEFPAFQVYKLPESLDLKHGLLCQPYSCVAVGWDNNGVVQDDAQILDGSGYYWFILVLVFSSPRLQICHHHRILTRSTQDYGRLGAWVCSVPSR